MLISIIVPTRNRVALLTRALQAIHSQTHQNYEVLVVDDGSGTQTRAQYAALFAHLGNRFRLFIVGTDGQRGQGPSASRNLGISLAQGDVLAYCDDDDFWLDSSHLSAVSQLFERHAGVDLCISNQRAVFVDGSVSEHWLPVLNARVADLQSIEGRFMAVSISDLCNSGGFAHLNMLCVRRKVVQSVGGFWEAVNYEEDRDFFWRCADACGGLAYTVNTVAQHHVPDPAQRVNVSSAIQQQERWLVAAMASRHIAITVKSQAIARLFLHHEGDLLRRLAMHCAQHRQPKAAWLLARQALGARFSFKWAAYCLWVWVKSLRH